MLLAIMRVWRAVLDYLTNNQNAGCELFLKAKKNSHRKRNIIRMPEELN